MRYGVVCEHCSKRKTYVFEARLNGLTIRITIGSVKD